MSVNSLNKEYQASVDDWKLVNDCVKGERAVKFRKQRYLPKPNASDKTKENEDRYASYLARAQFVNFTARTKRALIGSVFRKKPEIEMPSALEYLIEDASRNGIKLENLIKLSVGDVLETGRGGILADYPQAEEALTLAETMKNRAYVIHYPARQIINWHVNQGGQLDLVVLKEQEEVQEGTGFDYVSEDRYRVLILVDSVYQQWYYDEGGVRIWQATPLDSAGRTFNEIPWSWLGAEDNDETLDISPLLDIANINIGHYRNSADYEESSFVAGQPMLHIDIGETSPDLWKEENPNGVLVGAKRGIITRGGKMELVQAEPNNLPNEAMKRKEEQMVAIGARIIQDNTGVETAEAARIRHSGETSVLISIVENVESGYERVLRFCARFMGADEESIAVNLNRDFFDSKLSAQEVMAIIQLGDAQLIAPKDQRSMMRTGRIEIDSDRTDEEIDSDISDNPPL